jgi:hypothetical protein
VIENILVGVLPAIINVTVFVVNSGRYCTSMILTTHVMHTMEDLRDLLNRLLKVRQMDVPSKSVVAAKSAIAFRHTEHSSTWIDQSRSQNLIVVVSEEVLL